jgi:hypothetical protein
MEKPMLDEIGSRRDEVVVHIGPPKTAATSLQTSLQQRTLEPTFFFGGTFQPRTMNRGSLSHALHEAVVAGDRNSQSIERVRKELSSHVEHGRRVLISEEMFLHPSHGRTISQKLTMLGFILEPFVSRVVITLRDTLSFAHKMSFSRFCRSDLSLAYDYEYIVRQLESVGLQRVSFIAYRDVETGELPLSSLSPEFDGAIRLSRQNSSKMEKDTRLIRGLRVADIARGPGIRRFLRLNDLNTHPFTRRLAAAAKRLSLSRDRFRTLTVPSDVAVALHRAYNEILLRESHTPQVTSLRN